MAREMKTYVADTKFNVGIDDSTSLTIMEGETIEFNGTQAIVGGDSYNLPRLRGAIKVGWLVEEGSGLEGSYRVPSAQINVRGATPQQQDVVHDGVTALSDDEMVVHTVEGREVFREGTASEVNEKAQTRSSLTTVFEERVQNSKYEVVSDKESETGQEAKPLGTKFKTSAQSRVDMSKVGDASTFEVQIEPSPQRRIAEGITFDNHNVGERSAIGTPDLGEEGIQKVGTVTKEPAVRANTRQEEAVQTQEIVLPEITEEERDEALDLETREGRWALAKIIYPDLPEWDFKMNWRLKIDLLKEEYSEQERVLRSIYAAESEAIKKRMKVLFDL